MKIETVLSQAVKLMFLAFLGGAVCFADTINFNVVPQNGTIDVQPLETVGWGYSIQNKTNDYLVPLGLSDSGVLYGSLTDIFDYPIVDPGQTAYQSYAFNAPGGFGNSLGLFEYTAPADLPPGLEQTGTFTLTYQLFDANPDLGNASPIGDPQSATVNFDLVDGPQQAVPEPGAAGLIALAIGALLFARRYART